MTTEIKVLAWISTILAGISMLLLIIALLEFSDKSIAALPAIGFFLTLFTIPSVLLHMKARTLQRRTAILAFIKAVGTFSLSELLQRFGGDRRRMETLVLQLAIQNHIPLSFDPVLQQFGRNEAQHTVVPAIANCPNCKAPLSKQTIGATGTPICPYCKNPFDSVPKKSDR